MTKQIETETFTIRIRKERRLAHHRDQLWTVEFAPGCFTNLYAATREEVLARFS